MVKGIAIALASFVALTSLAQAGPAIKIAYVDFQKAINQCQKGKKARKRLARWFQKKQEMLNRKQDELKRLQEDISRQSLILKEEARFEKKQEYQMKLRDFQRLFNDSQNEMKREERKLTRPIINDLSKIVTEIGEKEGYTFIFMREQSGIIFAQSSLDITQRVVEIYDARVKVQGK